MHDLFGDRQDWKLEKTDKTEIGDIGPVKRSSEAPRPQEWFRVVEPEALQSTTVGNSHCSSPECSLALEPQK